MINLPGDRADCQCCRVVDEVDLRTALERAYCAGVEMALEAGRAAFEHNPYGFELSGRERYLRTLESMNPDPVLQKRIDEVRENS